MKPTVFFDAKSVFYFNTFSNKTQKIPIKLRNYIYVVNFTWQNPFFIHFLFIEKSVS